jgi:phage-related protein
LNIHLWTTNGGKNLIYEYLDSIDFESSAEGYKILEDLEEKGLNALESLTTRPMRNKLYEIKFAYQERYFYVIQNQDNFYVLHICKKQKGKAEKFELDKAIKRAKLLGNELGIRFI